jgi:hypothetical protein
MAKTLDAMERVASGSVPRSDLVALMLYLRQEASVLAKDLNIALVAAVATGHPCTERLSHLMDEVDRAWRVCSSLTDDRYASYPDMYGMVQGELVSEAETMFGAVLAVSESQVESEDLLCPSE